MQIDTEETAGKSSRSKSTIGASLAALGSVVLASTCCVPMFPFLLAAGAAGSSALFTRLRPFLMGASVVLVCFGFYQRRRAKRCQARPGIFSAILLWSSAVVVVVSILFPEIIANVVANFLAR